MTKPLWYPQEGKRHFPEGEQVFRVKLPKPKGVIRRNMRRRPDPALLDWLAENCQSEYRVYFAKNENTLKVNFISETEAATFKLVWG